MCGRFTLTAPAEELAQAFGLGEVPDGVAPRFNIAPTQSVAMVRQLPDDGRRMDMARWGLIPFWSKNARNGNRMINARAETVAEKPAFRAAFRRRRCLIPADGFYEWKPDGDIKQPYWIGLQDRQVFAFAGLWERWEDPAGGHPIESCAIITTAANASMAPLHDRMPVILPLSAYAEWLDVEGRDSRSLLPLLQPEAGAALVAYPVSRRVNNPANEDAELLRPTHPG